MAHPGTFPSLLRPKDDEVHLWIIRLSQIGPEIAELSDFLNPDEKQKAARFFRNGDQRRFIVAHGVLRQLLGGYLSAAPEALNFTVNDFGKPALVRKPGDHLLSFNLAHSGDVILYGVANGQQVGVDVEAIRDDLRVMELAEGQFSAHELAVLQATPPDERVTAFFRCWTRKEAYLKARGEGLGFPLNQFSVTFGPNEAPAVHWASDDPLVTERWSMFDLVPAPGYAGAVVMGAKRARIVSCHWPPRA